VVLYGSYALVLVRDGTLRVVDARRPEAPREVAVLPPAGEIGCGTSASSAGWQGTIKGHALYMLAPGRWPRVIDIGRPEAPRALAAEADGYLYPRPCSPRSRSRR